MAESMKQLDKNALCSTCYGCNRLENEVFAGVQNCSNYIKATTNITEHIEKCKEICKEIQREF